MKQIIDCFNSCNWWVKFTIATFAGYCLTELAEVIGSWTRSNIRHAGEWVVTNLF